MMRPYTPYKGWDIDASQYPKHGNFKEQMLFLLGFAILAPSTFNTQPWRCKINKDHIEIYLNLLCITKTSDKMGRFAHVSMGCFISNLLIAAAHFGWNTKVEFLPSVIKIKHNKLIAKVFFKKHTNSLVENDLFSAITQRVTNRSLSLTKGIAPSIIHDIAKLSTKEQQIVILGDTLKNELVDISLQGDDVIWSNYAFRKEHVQWVRHNLTRKHDGMPGFGVGIPLILSLFGKPMILSPLFSRIQAKKNKLALLSSSYFIVLCGKDNETNWVTTGIVYEKIALFLSTKGIAVAPMGQFIEDEASRKKLQQLLPGKHTLLPQLFFRIGYPTKKTDHSPRFFVDDIII